MRTRVSLSLKALDVAIRGVASLPVDMPERDHALYDLLSAYALANAFALPAGPITKWEAIHPIERAELDATPFISPEPFCSKCGTPLPTEGAFARHYTVTNRHYLNLGTCSRVRVEEGENRR